MDIFSEKIRLSTDINVFRKYVSRCEEQLILLDNRINILTDVSVPRARL